MLGLCRGCIGILEIARMSGVFRNLQNASYQGPSHRDVVASSSCCLQRASVRISENEASILRFCVAKTKTLAAAVV